MRVRALLRLVSLGVGGRLVVFRVGGVHHGNGAGLTEGVAPSEATRIVPGLTEADALGCAEVPSAS